MLGGGAELCTGKYLYPTAVHTRNTELILFVSDKTDFLWLIIGDFNKYMTPSIDMFSASDKQYPGGPTTLAKYISINI